jgi:hypothetical protein
VRRPPSYVNHESNDLLLRLRVRLLLILVKRYALTLCCGGAVRACASPPLSHLLSPLLLPLCLAPISPPHTQAYLRRGSLAPSRAQAQDITGDEVATLFVRVFCWVLDPSLQTQEHSPTSVFLPSPPLPLPLLRSTYLSRWRWLLTLLFLSLLSVGVSPSCSTLFPRRQRRRTSVYTGERHESQGRLSAEEHFRAAHDAEDGLEGGPGSGQAPAGPHTTSPSKVGPARLTHRLHARSERCCSQKRHRHAHCHLIEHLRHSAHHVFVFLLRHTATTGARQHGHRIFCLANTRLARCRVLRDPPQGR